jgi:8-oxo-dGTP diphosphatase
VTVDVIVLRIAQDALEILLIRRGKPPFEGMWAIPGGFVDMDETLDAAARRELREETGLCELWMEQLYTFGSVDRDPRGRCITVAYFGVVPSDADLKLDAGDDANQLNWFASRDLPDMAFDHQRIIEVALQRLRNKLMYSPVGFRLMPETFTIPQFQRMFEIILDAPLDKRNFRRKIRGMEILEDTGQMIRSGAHRPAKLYRVRPEMMENEETAFALTETRLIHAD